MVDKELSRTVYLNIFVEADENLVKASEEYESLSKDATHVEVLSVARKYGVTIGGILDYVRRR